MVAAHAFKPVKNLEVTFRGQSYTIRDGCSTVKELTEVFEKASGNRGMKGCCVVCNGTVLKPEESLAEAGVKPGDKILLMPAGQNARPQDMLATCLFLLSNGSTQWEANMKNMTDEQREQFDNFKEVVWEMRHSANTLSKKDVADALRHGFDVAYHRLRSMWEHPQLRQALHDPEKIEAYRKVVATNMSPVLLKKLPSLQKAVKAKDEWRKEFVKAASSVIRLGDVIMDGVLDLLLDVLKGQGSSSKYANGAREGTLGALEESSTNPFIDPRASDPALANELLFELSESDEE